MIDRPLVTLAYEWAIRCFGYNHVHNRPLRGLRIIEEALELAQALGVPKEKVEQCVNVVYSRQPGDYAQEIGGVLLTTNVLCASLMEDPEALFVRELSRVLAKNPDTFTRRDQDKSDIGLFVEEGMRGT